MKYPVLLVSFVVFLFSTNAQFKKYSFQQPKMGSLFNIVIYSLDSLKASLAAAHAYRLIDTLNGIYSDYISESELNRLCEKSGSQEWIRVSEPLYTVLATAKNAGQLSHGSFDITVKPLVLLWRTARQLKKLPNADSITAALKKVNYRCIEVDPKNKAIRLELPGMQLDLGGIAKGETAQRAFSRLCELGFPYSLIDAGGDIVAGDVPKGIDGWRISINLPGSEDVMQQKLMLRNKAVTTSGDVYQYVELDGKRYSHVIDPRRGYALTGSRNVTVIADRGVDADWLTKACSILPIDSAVLLIKQVPSAELQIGFVNNGRPAFIRSAGFEAYFDRAR